MTTPSDDESASLPPLNQPVLSQQDRRAEWMCRARAETQIMQIEFEDTLQDWVEANSIYQRQLSWPQRLREWKLPQLVALYALLYAWKPLAFEQFYELSGPAGVAGLGAIIVLSRWLAWRRRINANFSALCKRRGRSATCMTFESAGVQVHSLDTSVTLRWGFFRSWAEGPNVFVLLADARSLVVVPKRALAATQLDDLRATLKHNVGHRQSGRVELP